MGNRLYVGNIPFETSEDQLRNAFAVIGEVVDVKIITDKYSGRSRGFAFVEMASEELAKQATEKLNGTNLGGRDIVVNEARPQNENRRWGRGYPSERGSGGDQGPRY